MTTARHFFSQRFAAFAFFAGALALIGLGLGVSGTAAAQEAAWTVQCQEQGNPQTCAMVQHLFVMQQDQSGQQRRAKVLSATVLYTVSQDTQQRDPYISLQMPMGVDLRPGAVLRVDGGGQEYALRYLRCTQAGCDASLRLTPELVEAMRRGNELNVGFLPWGGSQVMVVNVSLAGFSRNFLLLK